MNKGSVSGNTMRYVVIVATNIAYIHSRIMPLGISFWSTGRPPESI